MNDELGADGTRDNSDLGERTKRFAMRIIHLYGAIPTTTIGQVIGKQLVRSGTSVGAHYREARRARSRAEFISKIEGALQELDETGYWLELLTESQLIAENRLTDLRSEVEQLLSILVASVKTAKSGRDD